MSFLPLSVDPNFIGSGSIVGASVLSALSHGAGHKYKSMSMAGIHPRKGTVLNDDERTFQFMPDTINDSIEIGWSFKEIAGASASLAEWSSNGGRTLSFEVPVVRTMLYTEDQPSFLLAKADPTAESQKHFNEDVNCFLKFARSMCYPILDGQFVLSPPIVALNVPNMKLGSNGESDIFYGVMTECSITYEQAFQNGKVTIAKLGLALKEVVQRGDNKSYDFQYHIDMHNASVTGVNARNSSSSIKGFK